LPHREKDYLEWWIRNREQVMTLEQVIWGFLFFLSFAGFVFALYHFGKKGQSNSTDDT
jgi:hypothetical protein